MDTYILIALIFIVIMWLGLLLFVIMLHQNLKKMTESFAKLGYIAREDTKKYFDESSDKALDVFKKASESNKQLIESTMEKVLKDSASLVKETITEAEKDAAAIVSEARYESLNLKREAQEESNRYFDKVINDATQAVDWSLEQFIKDNYTMKNHEDMIKRLIQVYVDEHRKS